jgi:hypothetical protein
MIKIQNVCQNMVNIQNISQEMTETAEIWLRSKISASQKLFLYLTLLTGVVATVRNVNQMSSD